MSTRKGKETSFSLYVPNAETRAAIRALKSGEGTRVSLKDFVREMREIASRV